MTRCACVRFLNLFFLLTAWLQTALCVFVCVCSPARCHANHKHGNRKLPFVVVAVFNEAFLFSKSSLLLFVSLVFQLGEDASGRKRRVAAHTDAQRVGVLLIKHLSV